MICPVCRADNLQGEDYCWNCGHDLRGMDVPVANRRPGPESAPDFIYVPVDTIPLRAAPQVNVNDPCGFAVRKMQNEGIDCVLVMRDNALAGIITPWDILHKVAGPREDLNAVTCGDMMTPDPVYLRHDDDLAIALNKMSIGGFRHLPIIDGDGQSAVLAIGDLFRYLAPRLA